MAVPRTAHEWLGCREPQVLPHRSVLTAPLARPTCSRPRSLTPPATHVMHAPPPLLPCSGSPVIWWSSALALIASVFVVGGYLLRWQRSYVDFAPGTSIELYPSAPILRSLLLFDLSTLLSLCLRTDLPTPSCHPICRRVGQVHVRDQDRVWRMGVALPFVPP